MEKQEFQDEYDVEKAEYDKQMGVYKNSPAYQTYMQAKARNAPVVEDPEPKGTKSGERRIDIQQAEDADDPDDGLSVKHLAHARFTRNHRLINEIFSETMVPDVRSVVSTNRMQVLKRQVQSLTHHQQKLEAELTQIEEKYNQKKRKFLASSEDFNRELKKHCSKVVDEKKYTEMVAEQLDKLRNEREERARAGAPTPPSPTPPPTDPADNRHVLQPVERTTENPEEPAAEEKKPGEEKTNGVEPAVPTNGEKGPSASTTEPTSAAPAAAADDKPVDKPAAQYTEIAPNQPTASAAAPAPAPVVQQLAPTAAPPSVVGASPAPAGAVPAPPPPGAAPVDRPGQPPFPSQGFPQGQAYPTGGYEGYPPPAPYSGQPGFTPQQQPQPPYPQIPAGGQSAVPPPVTTAVPEAAVPPAEAPTVEAPTAAAPTDVVPPPTDVAPAPTGPETVSAAAASAPPPAPVSQEKSVQESSQLPSVEQKPAEKKEESEPAVEPVPSSDAAPPPAVEPTATATSAAVDTQAAPEAPAPTAEPKPVDKVDVTPEPGTGPAAEASAAPSAATEKTTEPAAAEKASETSANEKSTDDEKKSTEAPMDEKKPEDSTAF